MGALRVGMKVRATAAQRQQIALAASRLGLTVNDYLLALALGDDKDRAGISTLTARIDALETALTAALVDRDERLSEALDGLAERMTTAAHTDADALNDRIAETVRTAIGGPTSGVTVATLQRLSRSIETVIQRELGRLARGEYRPTNSTAKKA